MHMNKLDDKVTVSPQIAVTDVAELAEILRDDPALTSCLVNRAFSYGTARMPSDEEFGWRVDTRAELVQAEVTWRDLMRRITRNPDFYTNVVD